MAKTSRDAWRHIREIGKFFRDTREVSEMAIEEFLGRYRKRKYFRQSLQRLVQRGIIVKRDRGFALTLKGLRFFAFYEKRQQKDIFFLLGMGSGGL